MNKRLKDIEDIIRQAYMHRTPLDVLAKNIDEALVVDKEKIKDKLQKQLRSGGGINYYHKDSELESLVSNLTSDIITIKEDKNTKKKNTTSYTSCKTPSCRIEVMEEGDFCGRCRGV